MALKLTREGKQSHMDYIFEMKQNWMLNMFNSNLCPPRSQLFCFQYVYFILYSLYVKYILWRKGGGGDMNTVFSRCVICHIYLEFPRSLSWLLLLTKDSTSLASHLPSGLQGQFPNSEIWDLSLRRQADIQSE